MRKYKTSDGYNVYKVKKDNEYYFLGDKKNYQKHIDDILSNIDDLKYDSIIIMFGCDTCEYLKEINKKTCDKNKILILEPNKEVFLKNKSLNSDKTAILLFDKKQLKNQLYSAINYRNFSNLYVCDFGNYKEVYKEEYDLFIEELNNVYFAALGSVSIANRFREEFMINFICNLNVINNSITLNSCIGKNENVPAFIISAGPSLEKNIKDMMENRGLVEKSIVISGSRTLKTLLENNIKPDYLLTIDPVDYNYEMVKEYLESDIPLAFYEYSNRKIIREYNGDKVYLTFLLANILDEFNSLRGTYLGGSVAHTAVDMARALGCNPIILLGQDCAHTYEKPHSKSTTFDFDEKMVTDKLFNVKDVYGNDVKTTTTLNMFRNKMEEYIDADMREFGTKYINASYGADIKGTSHIELKDVFKLDIFDKEKSEFEDNEDLNINQDEIINRIIKFVSFEILEAEDGIKLCNDLEFCDENLSLMELEDSDERLLKFLEILEIVDHFEESPDRIFLEGYFNKFIFDIKVRSFQMLAKDYDRLTSNLKYQTQCFKVYFEEMEKMLIEVKRVTDIAVKECREMYR